MKVKLDRKDLIALLNGVTPHTRTPEHPLFKKAGYYVGGFVDKWVWTNLGNLSNEELWELYTKCKNHDYEMD